MTDYFESVAIGEGWGHADDTGFRLDVDPRAAGREFVVCSFGDDDVAVFVGQNIGAAEREHLVERRPSWLAAVVFAEVTGCNRELAILDVELSPAMDLARCAFAAVCSAYAAGAFDVTPAHYLVRSAALGSVSVTATFDDDAETWFGQVS